MTREELLLTQLSEECSEVIQNVSKTLRFGGGSIYKDSDLTNLEKITSELNDLFGVYLMMAEEGIIPHIDYISMIKKREKVEHFMKYSLSIQNKKDS